MDRGAWRATIHGIRKSRSGPNDFHIVYLSILIGVGLLYNVVFLSAIQQCESPVCCCSVTVVSDPFRPHGLQQYICIYPLCFEPPRQLAISPL